MMNMYKGTPIVIVVFILLIIFTIVGYNYLNIQKVYEPFTPGQNLTDEQKSESINIALNDNKVKK